MSLAQEAAKLLKNFTVEQQIQLAIRCAMKADTSEVFRLWAEDWISCKNRAVPTAHLAYLDAVKASKIHPKAPADITIRNCARAARAAARSSAAAAFAASLCNKLRATWPLTEAVCMSVVWAMKWSFASEYVGTLFEVKSLVRGRTDAEREAWMAKAKEAKGRAQAFNLDQIASEVFGFDVNVKPFLAFLKEALKP